MLDSFGVYLTELYYSKEGFRSISFDYLTELLNGKGGFRSISFDYLTELKGKGGFISISFYFEFIICNDSFKSDIQRTFGDLNALSG